MGLTCSIIKATNNVSNSPAQVHAHHAVGALPHSSTTFASPFSTVTFPWDSVPIDHHRRMWFITSKQHPVLTADRLYVM